MKYILYMTGMMKVFGDKETAIKNAHTVVNMNNEIAQIFESETVMMYRRKEREMGSLILFFENAQRDQLMLYEKL